jgi:hypothetical protein
VLFSLCRYGLKGLTVVAGLQPQLVYCSANEVILAVGLVWLNKATLVFQSFGLQ